MITKRPYLSVDRKSTRNRRKYRSSRF